MDDGKIQTLGVKEKTLDEAKGIHYECVPSQWQMFEILVSFCKDCPKEFTKWKKDKLKDFKKQILALQQLLNLFQLLLWVLVVEKK